MKKREIIYWIVMLVLLTIASMAGVMAQTKGDVQLGNVKLGGFDQKPEHSTVFGIEGSVVNIENALDQTYQLAFVPDELLTEHELLVFFIRFEDYFNFFTNPIKINKRETQWHQTVHHYSFDLFVKKIGHGKNKRYEIVLIITNRDLQFQTLKLKTHGLKK